MAGRPCLILCEFATLNGGERSMLATLDTLDREGFPVMVLAPRTGPLADALAERPTEVLPFSTCDPAGRRLPQHVLREQLGEVLDRCRPRLLHANSLAMGRLSGPVAMDRRVPSLAHLRDIVTLSHQAIADLNCHRRLLAVSEATRRFHVERGLQAEKTVVLYNGVDLEAFRPRRPSGFLHRELHLPPGAVLIGTIGQIGLRKGQDVLLQAAPLVEREGKNVHYLLLGTRHSGKDESREFEARLHEAAGRLPPGIVHFLGTRRDVAEVLNDLTLLVHPARQEPLGRVLLEAAATGLPVVATEVGGTREIFPPESHSARLVPPNDAVALAVQIVELLSDDAARKSLGFAARRRAEEAFSIERAASGLVKHYQEVAGD